ncbi:glycosyltransferase family 39 protein [Candidatus Sumerlaeota bacterium]|nr:glycosyltransferase family 39 protein [Candidatus Sumerlaeota bacterium]
MINNKNTKERHPLLIALRILAVLLLFLLLIQYVWVSVHRISYPFELEWNEGDMAIGAIRVLEGKPLYPPPEKGYACYSYPPLYYMVCGLLFKIFGVSLSIGRAVSFAASLGLVIVLVLIVYNWTKDILAGALAGLFYIACYRVSGFWIDLMRLDSLAWFLSFSCILLLFNKNKPSSVKLIIAGILATAAAFTKQNAVFPIILASLFLLIYHHRRAGVFFLTGAILTVNIFWVLAHKGNTWIVKYYLLMPRRHPMFWKNLKNVFPEQFIPYLWIPLIFLGVWLIFSAFFPRRQKPITTLWFLLLTISSFIGGLLPYLKIGGYINNFIPLLAVVSLLMGIGFHFFWSFLPPGRLLIPKLIVHFALLVLLVFTLPGPQFLYGDKKVSLLPRWRIFSKVRNRPSLQLIYRDKEVLPYPGSRERGKELIKRLRNLPGKVYVPHHNYYAYLAGKGYYYSIDTVRDIAWGGVSTPQPLRNALQHQEFDWIVLDMDLRYEWVPGDVRSLIQRNYIKKGRVIQERHFLELSPVTGCTNMKPRFLWQSRKSTLKRTPRNG